jgi:hypothetical protein
MSNHLQSIVVLGNNLEAWMAAVLLASQQYVHRPEIRIMTGVQSEVNNHVQAPLPDFSKFLGKVGIGVNDLILKCEAMPRFGTRYHLPSGQFVHIWGEYGAKRGLFDFHQILLKAMRSGVNADLNQLSIAAAAVVEGKLIQALKDPASIFSTFEASLTFSSRLFIDLLVERAKALNIIIDSRAVKTLLDRGSDVSVILGAGEELSASFAINTSSQLRTSDAVCEAWGSYIPSRFDERHFHEKKQVELGSDVVFDGGATLEIRQHIRSGIETIRFRMISPAEGDARGDRRESECVSNPFGNRILHIGKAAVSLPPVLVSEADLAWISLSSLLKFFPAPESRLNTNAEYNEVVFESFKSIRDITQTALELLAKQVQASAYIEQITGRSEANEHRKSLFAYRGKLPFYEHEVFKSEWQTWLFWGLGLIPRCFDPLVEAMGEDQAKQIVTAVQNAVNRELKALPGLA